MEKIQDKTWTESQDVKFIENLNQLIEGFRIAIHQNNLMVQLFNEYGMALHNVLSAAIATENDNVSNTNFSEPAHGEQLQRDPAMAGNRAERRAQEKPKRKTPFDRIPQKEHSVSASNADNPKQN